MRRLVIAFAAVLLSATGFAADLSGIWVGQIPARNGDLQDIAFKLVQSPDGKISGKLYRDSGSVPIKEGAISGREISFILMVDEQVGNLFVPIKYTFSGTISDPGDPKAARLNLTRERENPPNNELANGPNKVNAKPNFTLRRLL